MIDCPMCKERTFNPHPRRWTCSSCGSVVPAFGQAIIWGRFPVPEGHTFVRLKDGKLLTKTDGSPFFVPYGYKVARRIDGSVFEKSDATPWLVPNDYSQDEQGNFRSATRVRIEDGHVKVEHDYLLEPGATTL